MLAVAYKGVAFPLLWELLPKQGNPNTEERISLISRFVQIFGVERIQCLTVDRDFTGLKWFTGSMKIGSHFVSEFVKISPSPRSVEIRSRLKSYLRGLKKGRTRVIREQRKICGATLYIVGLKINPRPCLILVTNKCPEEALSDYK